MHSSWVINTHASAVQEQLVVKGLKSPSWSCQAQPACCGPTIKDPQATAAETLSTGSPQGPQLPAQQQLVQEPVLEAVLQTSMPAQEHMQDSMQEGHPGQGSLLSWTPCRAFVT